MTRAPAQPGLTSNVHRPDHSTTRPGQWNPAPTRRDSRATGLPTISPAKRKGPPTPSADPHDVRIPIAIDSHLPRLTTKRCRGVADWADVA